MYCRHGGQCLLKALTARNVEDIPCQQIKKYLDVLAESVLDCSARAAIYKCAKKHLPYVSIADIVAARSIRTARVHKYTNAVMFGAVLCSTDR